MALWTVLWALAGCAGDRAPPRGTSTDSAGVRIVEYAALEAVGEPHVTVSQPPRVRLGGSGARAGAEFAFVTGARVLSDGRIVVADGVSKQLHFFDPSGAPSGVAGREGEGPGEYLSSWLVGLLPGDSLVVLDGRQRRVSILAASGSFVRSFPLPDEIRRFIRGVGILPSGFVVFAGAAGLVLEGREHLVQDTVPVLVVRADGTFMAEFAERPAEAAYEGPPGHSPRALQVPFMPGAEIAAGASGIYVGHDQRFEIRRFDARGVLRMILRATVPRVPVTRAELDSLTEFEARASGIPEGIRSLIAMMPVPTEKRPHGQMVVDRRGRLWVRRSQPPSRGMARWLVFDSDGTWQYEATLPDGVVLDVGPSHVLLLTWDALDVPEVSLYELVEAEGPASQQGSDATGDGIR